MENKKSLMKSWLEERINECEESIRSWARTFESEPGRQLDFMDDLYVWVTRMEASREALGLMDRMTWPKTVDSVQRRIVSTLKGTSASPSVAAAEKRKAELRAWAEIVDQMKSLA